MNYRNVTQNRQRCKRETYEHYLAIDWSMKVMAIAHMTRRSKEPKVFERATKLSELKTYINSLQGRKVLAIEETTTAQWLYLELVELVERIIICDPYRNRLLSDGPKTDKIDAGKLCKLLRAGLLKEVFHSVSKFYELRCLVSAYEDVVRSGVRLLNQKFCFGQGHYDKGSHAAFIIEHIDKNIELYRTNKKHYEDKFIELSKHNAVMRNLLEVDGIGIIGAVKIIAIVVDARRFPRAGNYLSYCGLIEHEKTSGGRSYGRRRPRFNHTLKSVYKLAAMAVISGGRNSMRQYYDLLLSRGVAEHNARNALARYIARVTYGMLKTGKRYEPYQLRKQNTEHKAA
jgi:hypothetical protein